MYEKKITMTAISERKRAYIQEANKIAKRFIYKGRHFAKSYTFSVMFYIKNPDIYVKRFFVKCLRLAFIFKKQDTLCY